MTREADVIERLFREFEPTHGLRMVSEIVRDCRADLRDAAPFAPVETLEGRVRTRLATP